MWTLLAPAGLMFGVFIIPLLMLYMLRMRRREMPFSSLYLWEQALHDRQVNTPWRKPRVTMLLLLQLLALLLLVAALARPALRTPSLSGQNSVVLLDASASMQATDLSPNRFEHALQTLHTLIDDLPDAARMTIILVGHRPIPLVSSSDHATLHAALNGLHPENGSADWPAALALAAGNVRQSNAATLLVLSDGGLPSENLPAFPGTVRYLPVGTQAENIAITAFNARRKGSSVQLFVRLHNYDSRPRSILLSIYVAQSLLHAETLTLPPDTDQHLTLDGLPDVAAAYRAQLRPTDQLPDYLTLDDNAYCVYQPENTRSVLLISSGNLFLEQLLAAIPTLNAYRVALNAEGQPQTLLPAERFDAYVYDGLAPDTLPEGNLLLINPPPNPWFTVGETYTPTQQVQVSEHPLSRGVDWNSVFVQRAHRVVMPSWGIPLVQTGDEPLVFFGEYRGRRTAVVTFDLHESTLPLTVAYPILFTRLLEYLAPGLPIPAGANLSPGEPLTLQPGVGTAQLVIVTPQEETYTLLPQGGTLTFEATHTPGVYAVNIFESLEAPQPQQVAYFTVNLFDGAESAIAPAENITIPANRGDDTPLPLGQHEVWPWLGAAAFVLLLLEWWLTHR